MKKKVTHPGQQWASARKRRNKQLRREIDIKEAAQENISIEELRGRKIQNTQLTLLNRRARKIQLQQELKSPGIKIARIEELLEELASLI